MAQITIEIKDGYEVAIAKGFANFQYPDKQIPPTEEHLAAIESKIYELIEPYYKEAVKQDPEVVAKYAELAAKQAEYDALVAQKITPAK